MPHSSSHCFSKGHLRTGSHLRTACYPLWQGKELTPKDDPAVPKHALQLTWFSEKDFLNGESSSLIYIVTQAPFLSFFSFLLFFFFWPHRMACGILVPQPGNEPWPWQWKHQVLTTGPPGNSHKLLFCWRPPQPVPWTVALSSSAPVQWFLNHSSWSISWLWNQLSAISFLKKKNQIS